MSSKWCISEANARKSICPLTFGIPAMPNDVGAYIRHSGPFACIGDDCMAWRWVETNISDGKGGLMPSGDTHGYCGMAGPPWTDRRQTAE